MARKTLIILFALTLALPFSAAAKNGKKSSEDLWLHVRVEENDEDGEKVRINVPLELVESLLPLVHVNEFHGGKIEMMEWEMDEVDVRAVWKVLSEAKDGEFVTVEGTDQNVVVSKKGGYMYCTVEEEDESKVDVKVPLEVLDALFSGDDDELDILAAIRAMRDHGPGELVSVTDRDGTVRVWIDDQNGGK